MSSPLPFSPPPLTDTTLLLQGEAAHREIRRAVDEAVRQTMAEHGGAARQLYELLADQREAPTVWRLADLLTSRFGR